MNSANKTRSRASRPPLPDTPPGDLEQLQAILRILYARDAGPDDPLVPAIAQITASALARERACRDAGGAEPALTSLQVAVAAVHRLESAANAIPAPLDSIVVARLQQAGLQPNALAVLARVFRETEEWAREAITGSSTGTVKRGPGDLLTRLDGDGLDRVIEEGALLFGSIRGAAALSIDTKAPFVDFVVRLWTYATGEQDPPNLARRLREAVPPIREKWATGKANQSLPSA
jgi:hypothetical protein